jgi:hypothetical protein
MQARKSTEGSSCIVGVPGPFEGILLMEVARNCGYPARFQPGSLTRIEIRATEDQLDGMADRLTRAIRLFSLRRWEALAEAVHAVGGEPTQTLLNSLARARRRVEAFSTTDEGQDEQEDPSNN